MFYAVLWIRIHGFGLILGRLDPDPVWTHNKIWILICIDPKCWIRIRIEANAEPQHWFSIKKMLADKVVIKK